MFQAFPSINQFREVKRNVEWDAQFRGLDADEQPILDRTATLPTLGYEGTVKLHGTNAAINYSEDGVAFQSRENLITPEKDNAGFARWASELPAEVHQSVLRAYDMKRIVVFGEWCGGNIQKGVAISGLPKMFVVFAVQEITGDENNEVWLNLLALPDLSAYRIYNSRQFGVFYAYIDFEKPEIAIDKMNALTLEVENECPVGKAFGQTGVGEGIVWAPVFPQGKKNSRYLFKTKGSKHSETKVKKLAAVDPEKVANARAFAEKHVHPERLEQAYAWLAQAGHAQNEKSTGVFIKRVVDDVHKEESDELSFNGLTDKDVNGIMSTLARKWFFGKFNQ